MRKKLYSLWTVEDFVNYCRGNHGASHLLASWVKYPMQTNTRKHYTKCIYPSIKHKVNFEQNVAFFQKLADVRLVFKAQWIYPDAKDTTLEVPLFICLRMNKLKETVELDFSEHIVLLFNAIHKLGLEGFKDT